MRFQGYSRFVLGFFVKFEQLRSFVNNELVHSNPLPSFLKTVYMQNMLKCKSMFKTTKVTFISKTYPRSLDRF